MCRAWSFSSQGHSLACSVRRLTGWPNRVVLVLSVGWSLVRSWRQHIVSEFGLISPVFRHTQIWCWLSWRSESESITRGKELMRRKDFDFPVFKIRVCVSPTHARYTLHTRAVIYGQHLGEGKHWWRWYRTPVFEEADITGYEIWSFSNSYDFESRINQVSLEYMGSWGPSKNRGQVFGKLCRVVHWETCVTEAMQDTKVFLFHSEIIARSKVKRWLL